MYHYTPSIDDVLGSWVKEYGTNSGGGGNICGAIRDPAIRAHLEDSGAYADELAVTCSPDVGPYDPHSDNVCKAHTRLAWDKAGHPFNVLEMVAALSFLDDVTEDVMAVVSGTKYAQRVFDQLMHARAVVATTLDNLNAGIPLDEAVP